MTSASEPSRPFRIGEWTAEPSLNRITRGADSVQLEPRAMDVLVFLARHPGEVLSQQAIVDGVWAEEFVGDGVLRKAVAALRDALGDDAKEPTYIETITKRGYRLIAEITRAEPEPSPPPEPKTEGFRPRWTHALAVVAAVVIALLVVLPPEGIWQRITNQQPDELAAPPRIVVLPFENLGPPEDEYFADGMTEELITRLGVVNGLHVVSRTSAMSYKGSGKKINEIGEELNVEFVLEGTVRWSRDGEGEGRVRITPQLIRVADDRHLWSERYDRVVEEVFVVQSDIARRVIERLEVALLDPDQRALETPPTKNLDAYTAYLRGQFHGGGGFPETGQRALEMYQLAVELDPEFALAHAALSIQLSELFSMGVERTEDRALMARRAAERALEINPDLPEARAALGWYYDRCRGDAESAMREYAKVLEARPEDPMIHASIAWSHYGRRDYEEALEGLKTAASLDPQGYSFLWSLAQTYRALRRYQEAADTIDRAIAVAPDRLVGYLIKRNIYWDWYGPSQQTRDVLESCPERAPWLERTWIDQEIGERNYGAALQRLQRYGKPEITDHPRTNWNNTVPTSLLECACYSLMDRPESARPVCEDARVLLEKKVQENPERPRAHGALAEAYTYLGRYEDAIREAQRGYELGGPNSGVTTLAWVSTQVGEHDMALDLLEDLHTNRRPPSAAVLRTHPDWDPLRDHPRFQEILEKYDSKR